VEITNKHLLLFVLSLDLESPWAAAVLHRIITFGAPLCDSSACVGVSHDWLMKHQSGCFFVLKFPSLVVATSWQF